MSKGVLVVTGGASGIGRACAKHMARDYDNVVLVDLNENGLRHLIGVIMESE